eukprot:TRINITY_DN3916_c0_g3_i1.p1 TRINITY_DN3916_c0_g3~~TRINITY_DN3916_c0_g3_i1.p1  ORF type:complete len:214 (+),score=45.26 TRINITY_DN3916_c0_g3_i1:101-742(+)
MTKTSLKAKYDSGSNSASSTIHVSVDDIRIKATCSDSSLKSGGKLTGVGIGIDKPGAFSLDYELADKAAKFQFSSSATIAAKPVKLTYNHQHKKNLTTLEGTLILDAKNKVTGKYNLKTEKPHLKYSYIHGGNTILEPAYDFEKDSWAFNITHKASSRDTYKASYNSFSKKVGLEWARSPVDTGAFRIEAVLPVDGTGKKPSLILEKTWTFFK